MNKNIKTFNQWAEDGRDEKMANNHLKSVNRMIEIIKGETNKLDKSFKFLDIGCGNGWVVRKMVQYSNCKYALGIDGSKNMIDNAKKHNIGDFELFDLDLYNYKSKFDIIFSMETLYYIKNINNLFQKLYSSAIKNNGIFIMGIDHYKENKPSLNWSKEYNLDINTLSISEWEDLFLEHGFKNIKIEQYDAKNNWEGTLIIMGTKIER